MANYHFGLSGVAPSLKYGKGGGYLIWDDNLGMFKVFQPDGTTLSEIRVASIPSTIQSATSRQYVDFIGSLQTPKRYVRVATTSPGNLATDFANGAVVDGVTLATGDRILIKDQADQSENGIYLVQAAGAPIRAYDSSTMETIGGAIVHVSAGVTHARKSFICPIYTGAVLGTDPIIYNEIYTGGPYFAGSAINISSNVVSVDLSGLATTTTIDPANDTILLRDATDGSNKAIAISNLLSGAGGPFLPLTGGTITNGTNGSITLADASSFVEAMGASSYIASAQLRALEGTTGDRGISFGSTSTLSNGVKLVTPIGGSYLLLRVGFADAIAFRSSSETVDANVTVLGTSSITIPRGTTAQRPTTPVNGMFRYNNTLGGFEGYAGGAWKPFTSGFDAFAETTPTGWPAGGAALFTVPATGMTAVEVTVYTEFADNLLTGIVKVAPGDTLETVVSATQVIVNHNGLQIATAYNASAALAPSMSLTAGGGTLPSNTTVVGEAQAAGGTGSAAWKATSTTQGGGYGVAVLTALNDA